MSLDPDLVLLIFLPPLLYSAAFFANLRELRDNLRPITGLAVGLVAGTMAIVAVIGHEVIGLPWAAAFVLGAVVSPADAVAPAEILRRLNVPRRVITIVQGENLTNDWTALVAYKFAVPRWSRAASRCGRRARSSCSPASAASPSAWPSGW